MSKPSLIFHEIGEWSEGQIRVHRVPSSWRDTPEVSETIERASRDAQSRGGMHLFDGPMCRLESVEHVGAELILNLSQTSYKIFYGTNLTHPELAELARPVGVSPALISADNHLLLGRRNAAVAYYPNRIHPFAGALEPREDLDVFDEVRRELSEELSLQDRDVTDIVCTGLVEDTQLKHPELIFAARCRLERQQIEQQVDDKEHHASWSTPATPDGIAAALAAEDQFTPVARATMLLFRRIDFGESWFNETRRMSRN